MKKVVALFICCLLVVAMLVGCKGSDSDMKTDGKEQQKEDGNTLGSDYKTDALDLSAQAIADRKAEAEKTGKYQNVNLAFFTWTGKPAGLDRINARIKEHTRETLGLDVELMILDVSAYQQNIPLMLSSGEQVDIFTTCTLSYTNCVNSGYTIDLEEDGLLQNYGQGILNALKMDYLDACRIDGLLYGTPGLKDYTISTAAILIGEEYLDAIGYDYKANDPNNKGYINADWDLIEDLFEKLHKAFPDKYVYSAQDNLLNQGSSVDPVGGDFFGVLLDTVNSITIENAFDSDVFYEWCNRLYRWNQSGYISPDALTDTTGASARIKSGAYMSMMACGKPGYKTQISGECGRPMAVFQVGEDILKSSAVSSFPWCVNQNTEDKVATMQVLNAFYDDPYLSNLLVWGEEGMDYVKTDDGHIAFPEGVDANNAEYYTSMLWLMPNYFITHVWDGDPLDVYEQTDSFNNNAPKSKALGFSWDNNDYSAEFTALTNVYDEYAPSLTYGFVDPAVGIPKFVEKLNNAGLQEYMKAKQSALDAWALENDVN